MGRGAFKSGEVRVDTVTKYLTFAEVKRSDPTGMDTGGGRSASGLHRCTPVFLD